MPLFSDRERDDPGPKRYPETDLEFYERVAGPYWDAVRGVLESWFGRLPDGSRVDVRRRLGGKHRREFDGAFWELYLHELFRCAGFAVTYQPRVARPDAADLTPDLLVDGYGQRIYVEALVVADPDDESLEARRRTELVDGINGRVKSLDFRLSFEIDAMGMAAPPIGRIGRSLQGWLGALPHPDSLDAWQRRHGVFAWPPWRWREDGWDLEASPMPLPADQRDDAGPLIAFGPSWGKTIAATADARTIREALRGKAKRYRDLDAPFLVALLLRRGFTSDRDVPGALLGGAPLDETLRCGGFVKGSPGVDLDGLWATVEGPKRRHVSAVLVSDNLIPEAVARQVPTLWHGPWAERPAAALPFARSVLYREGGRLEFQPADVAVAEVLGLLDGWPPGEPFSPSPG